MVNLVQITITDEVADKLNSSIKSYQQMLIKDIEQMQIDGHTSFVPSHLPAWQIQIVLRDLCELIKFGRTIMVDLKTARLINEITNA